jgi:hypothetical protein
VLAEQLLSVNKLAFCIGVSREVLQTVAKSKTSHYEPYVVTEKKRDGRLKERRIDNPDKSIRKIQKKINKKILIKACKELPVYTTGSIPERSTYNNAGPHVGQESILLLDISDCFPSIRSANVYSVYKNLLGCSPPVANLLTKLTTYGDRLPQGAPTSPSLCNLVLAPLAKNLNDLAVRNGLRFTQYVDDLTFSGSYDSLRAVENEIIGLIEHAGFKVSRKKLKLIKHGDRMEVTGLVVNSKVSVGRRYLRKVQREIMGLKSDNPGINGKISYVRSISKAHARKLTRRRDQVLKQGHSK